MESQQQEINRKMIERLDRSDSESRKRDAALATVIEKLVYTVNALSDRINGRAS